MARQLHKNRRYHRFAALAVAISAATALAACSSSSPSSGSSSSSGGAATGNPLVLTGSTRTQTLVTEAKKEGSVSWYTVLGGDIVPKLVNAFKAEYPGIAVNVLRDDGPTLVSKVIQESQSKSTSTADVIDANAGDLRVLLEGGLLSDFTTPAADDVPAQWKMTTSDGQLTAVSNHLAPISFGYNTTKLPAQDVPKTLQDLLNPALKGKMAMTNSSTSQYFVGDILETLGQQRGEAFLKQLAKQDIQIEAVSAAALEGLVANGSVAASPTVYSNHVEASAKQGAPVKWVALNPVTTLADYVGITKATSHPAAAMLFMDFLLGSKAAAIYKSLFYYQPNDTLPFSTFAPDARSKTVQQFDASSKEWLSLFTQDFGK